MHTLYAAMGLTSFTRSEERKSLSITWFHKWINSYTYIHTAGYIIVHARVRATRECTKFSHGWTIEAIMDWPSFSCWTALLCWCSWKCWRPDREAQGCYSMLFRNEKLHQESSPLYLWWQRKSWWSSYIQGTCYSSKLVQILMKIYTTICKHLYKGSSEKT